MKKTFPLLVLICLTIVSCNNSKNEAQLSLLQSLQAENDSLKTIAVQNNRDMKNQISTFLTFQDNNAETAMNFYIALFDNSKIIKVQRWGAGAPVAEGKIMHATFELNGKSFMCSDSPPVHDWNFTPAVSNFIDCESERHQEMLFSKLSENGKVMMPLNNYGFSKRFGWVEDQFGISWQLNLPE